VVGVDTNRHSPEARHLDNWVLLSCTGAGTYSHYSLLLELATVLHVIYLTDQEVSAYYSPYLWYYYNILSFRTLG